MKTNPIADPSPRQTSDTPLAILIAEHPFVRGVSLEQMKILTDCAMRSHFEIGELIFRENDPANRFYLIQSGKVILEAHPQEGASLCIGTIGPGDVLGWSWLFPPYYWHFDARAAERTSASFFYGTRLREECEQDHDLGYELMKRMASIIIQRLQTTRRELIEAVSARQAL